MCPSNYNRFWDRPRYLWKNLYHTPLAFDAPVRGVLVGISAPPLVWCRYPMVKKFRRYVYSFWRDPRTRQTDRQTDGRTDTAWQQRKRLGLCIASRGKNQQVWRADSYGDRETEWLSPEDGGGHTWHWAASLHAWPSPWRWPWPWRWLCCGQQHWDSDVIWDEVSSTGHCELT